MRLSTLRAGVSSTEETPGGRAALVEALEVRKNLKRGAAVGLVSPVYILIPFLTPPLPGSRWHLFAFPLLLLTTVMVGRGLYRLVLSQPAFCRRTLETLESEVEQLSGRM